MRIICTKEEFASIFQQCCDNRMGVEGCGGCLFNELFGTDEARPCSLWLVDRVEIVDHGEE